jgi:hypothetical protein
LVLEKGEWKLRRRSASEMSAEGVGGFVLEGKFDEGGGGGIVVGLKAAGGGKDSDEGCAEEVRVLRAMAAAVSDSTDAMDGCAGSFLTFWSRLLASDVYITATFVEGEFMVPVKDHPIAAYVSKAGVMSDNIFGLTLA